MAAEPAFRVVGEVVDIDEGTAYLSTQTVWVTEAAYPGLVTPGKDGHRAAYRYKTYLAADPCRSTCCCSPSRSSARRPGG